MALLEKICTIRRTLIQIGLDVHSQQIMVNMVFGCTEYVGPEGTLSLMAWIIICNIPQRRKESNCGVHKSGLCENC
jgi:hypothetical protein